MNRKLLAIFLSLAMTLSLLPTTALATAQTFSDLPADYSTEALLSAVDNGLLSGDNGLLMPDDALTRAQMAAIMVRAFGGEALADLSAYVDVDEDDWFATSMSKAVAMGLFQGNGAYLYPDATISRQEVFVILARAFALTTDDLTVLDGFADLADVADWTKASTAALVSSGIVQGDLQGNLNPTSNISRKEFAVIMDRLITTYITEVGTVTHLAEGSVLVRVADVTLDGVAVVGNLVLGDGAGDATLSDVTVSNMTLIRSGVDSAISVTGDANLAAVVIQQTAGTVAVHFSDNATAHSIEILSSGVTLTGVPAGTMVITGDDVAEVSVNGQPMAAGTISYNDPNRDADISVQVYSDTSVSYEERVLDALSSEFDNATIYNSDFIPGDTRFDSPELTERGDYGVGVRTLTITDPDPTQGREEFILEIFYPAQIPAGEEELAWVDAWLGIGIDHTYRASEVYQMPVRALRNADPDTENMPEDGYPIVVYSHGSDGASSVHTNITSALASQGYIVVTINHTGNSRATEQVSGAAALRYSDLVFTLDNVENAINTDGTFLYGLGDITNCAIVGHSMGGGGAMYMAGLLSDAAGATGADPRVRAVVGISPYAPDLEASAWENITIPTLTISGSLDDVATFSVQEENVSYMTNSDAYHLVIENGYHELITDPVPYFMASDDNSALYNEDYYANYYGYPYLDWSTSGDAPDDVAEAWRLWREANFNVEVTWDETRTNDILEHFINAFLAKELKQDDSMDLYLEQPADDISWGGFVGAQTVGLTMSHTEPTEPTVQDVYDGSMDVRYTDGNMDAFGTEEGVVSFVAADGGDYFAENEGWINSTQFGPDFTYGDTTTMSPELSYAGEYGIGVRRVELDGTAYELWYPAQATSENTVIYWEESEAQTYTFAGNGNRNVDVLTTETGYPLVVMADEAGSLVRMSYLAENLASKGYFVVSVGDQDIVTAIDALKAMDDGYTMTPSVINFESITLVGNWSAGYDVLEIASDALVDNIAAVISLAPTFDDDTSLDLAGIPVLMVTGTADQAAYAQTQSVYDSLSDSERYMLVYELAGTSVGLNPVPWFAGESYDSAYAERYESVWNQTRFNNFNQHFISAFLDFYVQGDASMEAYLVTDFEVYDDAMAYWWLFVWKGVAPYSAGGLQFQSDLAE